MPEGWAPALAGFRRLGLRWWRRNLLRTFRQWRQRTAPLAETEGRENRKVARTVHQGALGRCAWSSSGGRAVHLEHARLLRQDPVIARSLEVAADGLRRAAGPHALGHPDCLACWWEWVTGSTPFF